MKIYFTPSWNQYTFNSKTYEEGGQEYKLFVMEASRHLTFAENPLALLLAPNDNSTFAQQIKAMVDKREYYHIFATPAENLEFKPNFWMHGPKSQLNGLLIKDPNKVEKIVGEKSKPTEPEPQQITFKVVSQDKKENPKWRSSYRHTLQIEPLSLGIEGLPPINKLEFDFTHPSQPTAGGGPRDLKLLSESELHKNPILEESVGKTFTMKLKSFLLDDLTTLSIGSSYVFGSLSEKKSQDNLENPTETPPNNSENPPPEPSSNTPESQKEAGTLKVVLITGGIIVGLSFLAFIFYRYSKKKKKKISFISPRIF